jgi:hypothetical protein
MKSGEELATAYAETYTEKMRDQLRAYNANPNRPPDFGAAAEPKWNVGASCQIAGAAGVTILCASYNGGAPVPKEKVFTYSGVGGGLIIGGGATFGGFWCFVDHEQLAGDSGFSIEMITGGASIQFYRAGIGLIAHYEGGGITLGIGAGGGTGHFRLST